MIYLSKKSYFSNDLNKLTNFYNKQINYDIVIPNKKNYYNIAIYLYICLFIMFCLKFNISYLFYENYNMKNTFRLGLKYGCVLCKLISSTNGLKICNKSHFFRLGLKLYGLYIFVLHNLLTFPFFVK